MMKLNWHEWQQRAHDYVDNRYGGPVLAGFRGVSSERWNYESWRAWLSGRDPIDFVDEFMRNRRPEDR
jgi:hypothetical protein